jgi:NADH-ubiquinone oxidoreductase chain 6
MTKFDNIYNSYVFSEYYTNGFKDEFLLILSLISIILGILVITSKNPIISVLFLIGLFMSISFYLMFLGLNFLGISYLLVYIGAVSILFLFILMLINVRVSELLSDTYNSIILSVLITLYFSTTLNQTTPFSISGNNYKDNKEGNLFNVDIFELSNSDRNDVSYVSYESWDSNLTNISYITGIGNVLYTNYSIWLILTSVILLLAMVGCIIITIRQK